MIASEQSGALRQYQRIIAPPTVPPKKPEPMEEIYALMIAFQAFTSAHPLEAAR